jgi:1,4-alpha-glucan branching enzyme
MTPVVRENYHIPLPESGRWREIINSDAGVYGGSGKGNLGEVQASDGRASLTLPPLATLMLERVQ